MPLIHAVGRNALLVEVGGAALARAVARWARAGGVACVDAVPAAATVLLDGLDDPSTARNAVLAQWPALVAAAGEGSSGTAEPSRTLTLPVTYDGPDLEVVADLWDVSVDEVVRRHTSLEFVSAFCGFSPGFAYLEGLPEEWAVPRRETPRERVPLGSVALADTWCGVYPTPSPGGWLLLGTTTVTVWDLASEEPALLAPGTRVRFTA